MARYQVILAYDGSLFKGFQRQARARTIQGEFETALHGLGWQGGSILSAGRTDTGVHALGQVVAFDLDWTHSCDDLLHALNAALPEDIAVQAVRQAPANFHPRFHAVARTYRYRIYCRPVRDPLRERYAWRVWPEPELEVLHVTARLFVGRHDFAAFGTPLRTGSSTVREILTSGWEINGDELTFVVSANAFLYHMVRRMVFLQIRAGQSLADLEELRSGLERGQTQAPGLAPARGLTLLEVKYS